jgi:hypothetical protein
MSVPLSLGVLPAAVLMALASGVAQAGFKGIAINDVFDFGIQGIAANEYTSFRTTTRASASWGPNSEINPASLDPEVADCGPAGCDIGLPENVFLQRGSIPPTESSARGDALIASTDIANGNGSAHNVAEVLAVPGVDTTLLGPPVVEADGRNSLDAQFVLPEARTLTFSFNANPFLETWVDASDLAPPSAARASINFTISIVDPLTQVLVFQWNPDGVAGNALGGNDAVDEASLNRNLLAFPGDGVLRYDPAFNLCVAACAYLATVDLGAGQYNLAVTMIEQASGVQRPAVPLPATLGLIGAGIAGLGFTRRRRRA